MFQLVFRGECTPGTDEAVARSNARTLFKASVDQVERMFSGRPVVIRNKLDQEQAEKYRAVLGRHGMVAYVESMSAPVGAAGSPSASAEPAKPTTASAPPQPGAVTAAPGGSSGPDREPGGRLPVAGERVEEVLAGSALALDPVGTTLSEHEQPPAPVFEHLDDWTLAPPGADLGVERDLPPPVVPDVSHLSLVDEDPSGTRD